MSASGRVKIKTQSFNRALRGLSNELSTVMATFLRRICALCVFFGLSSCGLEEQSLDVSASRGASLFLENCAACHGEGALGDGPASSTLNTPPPDLTTLQQENDGVFPRDYVMGVIDGYDRRNHPTAAMPEFGEGNLGPVILVEEDGVATPTPAHLLALAAYIESIQR